VLLVFEDLHWVDSETQAVLDTLVASLPTTRLCLLVDYRPEYQHSWGSKTYYSQLRLDPLPPVRAQELLRGLLGEGPELERLTALLIERTEGNPFFLEETVLTLVDSHALGGERGARYLARPVDAIEVPSTVEAVLAARIDQLPAEARRLLQVAAVIGKDVPFALLRAVAQSSEDALRQGLATLQAAELLYEARLFPDVEYTFKHALTHEVAYGSLAPHWRARLHAEIVDAIERLYPDRQAEQLDRLAHHAFRGEVWGKAVGYLHRAGVKAVEHSAYREATACWEQALTALAHVPEDRETLTRAVDIRLDLWGRLAILGRYKAALDHIRRAEHLARVLDDRYRLGRALAGLSVTLRIAVAAYDQAVEAGQHAVAIATEVGDPDLQVAATLRLGQAYIYPGDYAAAAATLKRCVEIINRLDPSRERRLRRIDGLASLSRALVILGHATEAVSLGEAAVREADPRDDLWSFVAATTSLGLVHLQRRDLDRAISVLERAVATGREWSLVDWTSTAVSSLGYAYTLASRITEGLALLEEVVEQDRAMDVIDASHTRNVLLLGEALFVAGQADGAEVRARQALDLAHAHGERGLEAWVGRLLGRIASHRDPPDVEAAERHYRHVLALAHKLGMRPLIAHCHLNLGELYHRMGDHAKANEYRTIATTMYREMDLSFWLAQAAAFGGPQASSA
jgi:tetratricopeptide (TPR) repeat protein